MQKYSDRKEDSGGKILACFRRPTAFDTLEEICLFLLVKAIIYFYS